MVEATILPAVIQPSQIESGMTLRIYQKIKDVTPKGEEKERIQVFEGMVLAIGGKGASKSMTVRKISHGVGVERIFPLQLPSIEKIELVRKIKARRKNVAFVRDSKKRLREVKQIKLRAVA